MYDSIRGIQGNKKGVLYMTICYSYLWLGLLCEQVFTCCVPCFLSTATTFQTNNFAWQDLSNYHEGFDHLCAYLIVVQFVLYRSKLSRLVAHFLNYEMKSMLKAQYSARIVYDNVGIRYLTILWAAKRIFEWIILSVL